MNGKVIDEWWIWNDFKGSCRGVIEVLPWNLAGWTEENHENSVNITDVLAEIRSERLPITSLESCRYANPFG
jgi:hypothetical protein